ncbi:hypothetical protein FRC07_004486 [Ceratobasidium sp. 392]|nr:hypothetical protein FRC07_004486 [Ceratobasidium sp. 392]
MGKPKKIQIIAKAKGKGKASVERKPAPAVKKSAQGNSKKPTLVTTKKRKLGRPHKKRIRETTSESSLSDFDDFDEDDFLPYHGSGQKQQTVKRRQSVDPESGFATFVSASVFEASGSESGSDSETSDLALSGDSEIEAEEERLIVAEEKEERQRKLRELLMGSNRQNHTGGGGGQQWQIKPRRKSVEGEASNDDETSSESGGEDEEEDEDEDDPDEDEADGEEQAAAWSTDDEEDLFFANLSDSSMSFSADQDDEDDDDSETVSSTADLAEAANAGFLSGMSMPMVVMEDFGGNLGLGMGLGNVLDATDLDLEFEQRARAQLAEEKRSPEPASADAFSAEYDYTKEAMDAITGLEMDIDEEDTEATEYEEDSEMGGETTADEMERGRTPSRFRFPTPPTINPLATFTPSPATSPVGWRDFTPTHFRPTPLARGNAHTRAASFGGFAAFDMIRGRTISAGATNGTPGVNGSDGSASASEVSSRPPVMGSFGRTGDRRRAAIIDGSATVPSPFTARRRRSNSWKSGRKHFGTKSDIFPMLARRPRQNSIATTCSGRSSFHFTTEPEMDIDMESCTEPFELDDVLDFSNVSDEHPHHSSHVQGQQDIDTQGEDYLRSLDRWDRVPMGTFRRTREAHDTGVVPAAGSSDGFSYGAASRGTWEGGVLWGGGLSTLTEDKALLGAVNSGSDSFGNAGESSTGGFEKAVSRKERRRRKKLAASVPTKSFITPPPTRKV